METQNPVDRSTWSDELESMVQQIQEETLLFAVVGLFLTSLIILGGITGSHRVSWILTTTGGVALLGVAVRYLQKWNYLASAWLLVLGTATAIGGAIFWEKIPIAVYLLAVPAGLAVLTISRKAGIGIGVFISLGILLLSWFTQSSWEQKVITIMLVWSTIGMVWLALRSLISTIRWVWFGYHRNQVLLDRARDVQVQLLQTLEQLTEANIQYTRLNQLAQSLRLMAEEARRIKEQFVANVSHELRTPLNMIIGFCEMMTQSPKSYSMNLPPSLLADLTVVLRNSQHLSSLIDDVLDLSQIEAGQMTITRERSSLADIVQSAAIAVRPLYDSKNLSLGMDLPASLPEVFCDRTRIREVMLNLLSNAGRYTDAGGVTVRVWQERDDILVSVVDTGKGISPEAQKRLFQPFQQLDVSLQRRYGGTGLGLSISKQFIELHEGAIWVESTEGQGTTFFFRLPINPPIPIDPGALRWINPYAPYAERPERVPLPPVTVPPRLVVVEQGHTVQRLISRQWSHLEIAPAASMQAAIEGLQECPANLILVNQPYGHETLVDPMSLPENIPVVLLDIPGNESVASDLGVQEYLLKPISRAALLSALERLNRPIKTVLLVDDEPDALQLFSRILASSERGYRVLRAMNGQQALEILQAERPDVILLDLLMPEMDGLQVLSAKNQDPELRNIPVILTTARDPVSGPMVSKTLTVTTQGGLSLPLVLDCVGAITAVFAKHGLTGALTPQGTPAD
jgi:signal transduction histidine kinase